MLALVFSFSLAYNLAKNNGVNPLPAGIVGVAVFIATIPQAVNIPDKIKAFDEIGVAVTTVPSAMSAAYLSATGLFTALIMILIFIELYMFLMKRNITIKMPEQVPTAVAQAFMAVVPGMAAIYGSAIFAFLITALFAVPINDLIVELVQKPLLTLSQGYPAVLIVALLTQMF